MATRKTVAKKATKKAAAKRIVKARRQAKLHDDGSIANAVAQIQKVFGLPEGCVRLVNPSGRRAYATVGQLRKNWK
jgi:hypothetical protein